MRYCGRFAYKAEFQAEITRAVAAKLASTGGTIRPEEIGECAANVIFADDHVGERQRKAMEQVALKAYHAGKFRYLHDVLESLRDELQSSASRSSAVREFQTDPLPKRG